MVSVTDTFDTVAKFLFFLRAYLSTAKQTQDYSEYAFSYQCLIQQAYFRCKKKNPTGPLAGNREWANASGRVS